jgi:chitin synthase
VGGAGLNYNRAFRPYVVLVWMFCNAALVAVVLNAGGLARLEVAPANGNTDESAKVKTYLFIVLWTDTGTGTGTNRWIRVDLPLDTI